MNSKANVFKMLRKSLNEEAKEETSDQTTGGFGGPTSAEPEKETSETINTETEPPEDNSAPFGGGEELAADLPEEESDSTSAETSTTEETENDSSEDSSKNSNEEEKEETLEEKAFEEFKKLSEATEDSYDLLKFFKSKFYELKMNEFNRFLYKIVKDKELIGKQEVKDALLKLKFFFAS